MFKTIREKSNITQTQLAEILRVKQNTISMWETGKSMPKLKDLPRIASALGVSVEEIVNCFKK